MNILVTGGAGYIGSACVKQLVEKGYEVIVVDNLSKGKKSLVDEKAVFYQGDLVNKDFLDKVFKENKIDAVIHFAAYKAVGESMTNPAKYKDNILGTINLLDTMVQYDVKKIIFSSTAAVYGE
ncbi:MAG: UDP-glucose 4-epimerase, partial [Nanoarchaeota archaeon]|nr:UDP-glucose 4-epimerase [Nanoarchaeota archaeon]